MQLEEKNHKHFRPDSVAGAEIDHFLTKRFSDRQLPGGRDRGRFLHFMSVNLGKHRRLLHIHVSLKKRPQLCLNP